MSTPHELRINWLASREVISSRLKIWGEFSGVHNAIVLDSISQLGKPRPRHGLFSSWFPLEFWDVKEPKKFLELDNGDKKHTESFVVVMEAVVFMEKIREMLTEFEADFGESPTYQDEEDDRHVDCESVRLLLTEIEKRIGVVALVHVRLAPITSGEYKITNLHYQPV